MCFLEYICKSMLELLFRRLMPLILLQNYAKNCHKIERALVNYSTLFNPENIYEMHVAEKSD